MTRTVCVCDFCGREITTDERIYLKRKSSKGHSEMNYDFCPQCWERLEEEAKINGFGVKRSEYYEALKCIESITKIITKSCSTNTDLLVEHQKIWNVLVEYKNKLIEIENGDKK